MNPDNGLILAEQHRKHIQRQVAESRRGPVRGFHRWHLSWTKTSLSSASHRGSSFVIIISAHRPA